MTIRGKRKHPSSEVSKSITPTSRSIKQKLRGIRQVHYLLSTCLADSLQAAIRVLKRELKCKGKAQKRSRVEEGEVELCGKGDGKKIKKAAGPAIDLTEDSN